MVNQGTVASMSDVSESYTDIKHIESYNYINKQKVECVSFLVSLKNKYNKYKYTESISMNLAIYNILTKLSGIYFKQINAHISIFWRLKTADC